MAYETNILLTRKTAIPGHLANRRRFQRREAAAIASGCSFAV